MPIVIDIHHADDQRDVVHRAVQSLAEGKLVAFPTETFYCVAAASLSESAVRRLQEVTGQATSEPLTLAIRSAEDTLDYVPSISKLGLRLARRCWPGPVQLRFDDKHPDSLLKRLPAAAQKAICPSGIISLQVPAHRLILNALRLSVGPLVIAPAHRPGQKDAISAQDVTAAFGDDVSLVLDDGKCKFAQPASIVKIQDQSYELLRSGVCSDATLRRLASYVLLLVCTGNTCRSPMAEVLMQRRLAERIGCNLDQLEERGVLIMSAGIAAMSGGRATAEADQAVRHWGLSLVHHESQPLTDRLVRFADLILTMTRGHREAILSQWPEAVSRTRLVSRNNTDIADPIGGPQELYRRCAEQIDSQLEGWANEIDLNALPKLSAVHVAPKKGT